MSIFPSVHKFVDYIISKWTEITNSPVSIRYKLICNLSVIRCWSVALYCVQFI